jgi:hypothetical protein
MSTPTHRAYTVIKREGKEDYWLNPGVALDGKLVLRTYKEQPEEQEKVVKGKFKK